MLSTDATNYLCPTYGKARLLIAVLQQLQSQTDKPQGDFNGLRHKHYLTLASVIIMLKQNNQYYYVFVMSAAFAKLP